MTKYTSNCKILKTIAFSATFILCLFMVPFETKIVWAEIYPQ